MNLLDSLTVFCTVVEKGSFRTASKEMYRSQPAVSTAVKNLEEGLGVELFNRDSYRPALTENGKAIYERAKRLISQSEDLRQFSDYLAHGYEPEIRLAVSLSVPIAHLMPAMRQLQKESQQTHIKLEIKHPYYCYLQILQGQSDLAVSMLQSKHDAIEQLPLYDFSFVPVYAPEASGMTDQPEAKVMNDLPLADVSQIDTPIPGFHLALPLEVQWDMDDLTGLKKVITSGFAWGWLPEHMVTEELADGRIKEIESIGVGRKEYTIGIMYLKNKKPGAITQKFIDTLLASEWQLH